MKKHVLLPIFVTVLIAMLFCVPCLARDNERSGHSRTFRIDYSAKLADLAPGKQVRVWVPVPVTSEHQEVQVLGHRTPAKVSVTRESTYGNSVLSFEATVPADGAISFGSSYQVTRYEVQSEGTEPGQKANTEQLSPFLAANQLVPVGGLPVDLLSGMARPQDPMLLARLIYDRVDQHVRYDKSKPGYGNGDARWVCSSRFGNCTDFHSLFISLARDSGIPARFEIGFPLPPARGAGEIAGYHCWAFFHAGDRGWLPVDISEADKHPELKEYYFGNLTENRVTFSVGRDLVLSPPQQDAPLNYFVYPYAEIDGEAVSREQIEFKIRYEDQ